MSNLPKLTQEELLERMAEIQELVEDYKERAMPPSNFCNAEKNDYASQSVGLQKALNILTRKPRRKK